MKLIIKVLCVATYILYIALIPFFIEWMLKIIDMTNGMYIQGIIAPLLLSVIIVSCIMVPVLLVRKFNSL